VQNATALPPPEGAVIIPFVHPGTGVVFATCLLQPLPPTVYIVQSAGGKVVDSKDSDNF
jgi:hypothetical protein